MDGHFIATEQQQQQQCSIALAIFFRTFNLSPLLTDSKWWLSFIFCVSHFPLAQSTQSSEHNGTEEEYFSRLVLLCFALLAVQQANHCSAIEIHCQCEEGERGDV